MHAAQRRGRSHQEAAFGGHILGVFDEVELDRREIVLGTGDSILIYTDGLTDAVNRDDEDYGL